MMAKRGRKPDQEPEPDAGTTELDFQQFVRKALTDIQKGQADMTKHIDQLEATVNRITPLEMPGNAPTCHIWTEDQTKQELEELRRRLGWKDICVFTTRPSIPLNYKFVLPELLPPFRLHFTVRVANSAIIALATSRRDEDIFCHITLGGWSNGKAAIRTGDMKDPYESGVVGHAFFPEREQLSAYEDRPFWIEYLDNLVRVGKGTGANDGPAFMEWDVTTYYHPAPSTVNIAISTWKYILGEWVFEKIW